MAIDGGSPYSRRMKSTNERQPPQVAVALVDTFSATKIVRLILIASAFVVIPTVLLLLVKYLPVSMSIVVAIGCYGSLALTFLFGLAIVAHSDPLPPIAEMSVLGQRAAWLGRYAVGTILLIVGAIIVLTVQSEFDTSGTLTGSSNPITSIFTWILVPTLWLGVWIACLVLSIDLCRLGRRRRAYGLVRALRQFAVRGRSTRRVLIRVGMTMTIWYWTLVAFCFVPLLLAVVLSARGVV
ncbi:hypothetical protein [Rathayibacter soli]|uniref:hypothetical protein n=1 Tax=Rathayibacter soli TaxID=3144168 RepID=UPI0027E58094|nr:hypothetical protein [Glaciibacter superstes]